MKFTFSWLKDHLDTTASADDISLALTRIGLEVESIYDPAATLAPYVIAHVISAEQHPNADRLRVCMVDVGGDKPVQVVCGAPNARAGMKSVFSPPGTFIPGKNITISVGKVRGVESAGMLCSGFELGLSGDHEGIIDLPDDAPIGERYVDYAGLDDPVFDVAITPNRADALSVYGIARDLAAAGLGQLKQQSIKAIEGTYSCPHQVSIAAEAAEYAPAFALRLVRDVKNGPSPSWMQERLKAIGLRPINALVDVTNYITFDRGRPLHVFDADKVKGSLRVTCAQKGNSFSALDGRDYELDAGMIIISDDQGVESLAGIMGGASTGCDETTKNVLIESALWDPYTIARTGRALGINSDARYRFERGVDPAFMMDGMELATHLIVDLCGGEASHINLAGAIPQNTRTITFPFSEVERLTGLTLAHNTMRSILENLGFNVRGTGAVVEVTTPSYRADIEQKADVVEEIVRITGLDHITSTPFLRDPPRIARPVLTVLQKRTRLAKRALASRGLIEAITWSFVSADQAQLFGGGQAAIKLANPIASDLSDMRPSLLAGLIKAAQRNADRGYGDVGLFEVGQIFKGDQPRDQFIAASVIRRGSYRPNSIGRHWSSPQSSVDVFDAKADVMALLQSLGIATQNLSCVGGAPNWFHPGRSGLLQFGPKNIIGAFGEFHPRLLEALDVKGPLVGFEIMLDELPLPKAKATRTKGAVDLPELMPVERDFAFISDQSVRASDIIKAVLAADKNLISHADVFDIYQGAGVESGKISLAVSVILQPRDKTLTEKDIEAVCQKIIADVAKKTGAILRA
jgi:phenylalanyl-tRNA synthetase beta chain